MLSLVEKTAEERAAFKKTYGPRPELKVVNDEYYAEQEERWKYRTIPRFLFIYGLKQMEMGCDGLVGNPDEQVYTIEPEYVERLERVVMIVRNCVAQ